MYKMKCIISTDYPLDLPTCMYYMKNHNQEPVKVETELHICDQVMKFLKNTEKKNMLNLEIRQDQLLKKLDGLYEKIKILSSSCKVDSILQSNVNKTLIPLKDHPEELVLELSPDNLPFYLTLFLKVNAGINLTWHIHSTTSPEKILKIQSFFENSVKQNVNVNSSCSKVNIRLIFKNVSASSALKISSLGLPITGNVNILRYLCEVYPNIVNYDYNNHEVESILDKCYLLEYATEKLKQVLYQSIFQKTDQWIYGSKFSIVDLAVYNEIKQMKNVPRFIPQQWLVNCEKAIM